MLTAYIVTTILAALANGYAASMNSVGAESVKVVADRVHVSQKRMLPLGILLASGALGTFDRRRGADARRRRGGRSGPHFICAISAHVRVRDPRIAGAVSFLMLVATALIVDLAYRKQLVMSGGLFQERCELQAPSNRAPTVRAHTGD